MIDVEALEFACENAVNAASCMEEAAAMADKDRDVITAVAAAAWAAKAATECIVSFVATKVLEETKAGTSFAEAVAEVTEAARAAHDAAAAACEIAHAGGRTRPAAAAAVRAVNAVQAAVKALQIVDRARPDEDVGGAVAAARKAARAAKAWSFAARAAQSAATADHALADAVWASSE